jgi:hypothetical protein
MTATKRVLKWVVPVDDETHRIGSGPVVLVECQSGPGLVMVWTEEYDRSPAQDREVQVYGTGHDIPLFAEHLGSVMVKLGVGPLVWHVYALPKTEESLRPLTASAGMSVGFGTPLREEWP